MNNLKMSLIGLGLVLGIFIESYLRLGYAAASLFLVMAAVSFILWRRRPAQPQINLSAAILLLCVGLGIARMTMAEPKVSPLDAVIDEKILVSGVITEEPDQRENQTFLTLSTDWFAAEGGARKPVKTKILLKIGQFHSFGYGDRVEASSKIELPQSFGNEGGGEFNYPAYLAKDGIGYIMNDPVVSKISSNNGNLMKAALFSLKGNFLEAIGKNISEPEAALLGGLVVGGKHSLGKVWLDRFQRAGVMHIIVLSGYNITIIANSVIKFFGIFLSRVLSMSLGALAIFLFAIMTGGSATIVRATIMAMLVILARFTKRDYVVTRALIIAGVLMVFHNPWIVAFDPSFQLSFMATLSLIYVSPVIEERLKFLPERFQFRDVVVSTLSTQIFVLPLILSMTGKFSLVFLPVNLLILSFIPLTMLLGFLAGLVGMIAPVLALPFAYPAYALLFYELKVVEIFSSFPFASVSMPALSGSWVLIIYLLMCLALYVWHAQRPKTPKSAVAV